MKLIETLISQCTSKDACAKGMRDLKPDLSTQELLNGECKATLEYDGYYVSRVWIRHNSKAAVNVSDHAYITIDAMDNSYLVVAVAGNDAQVYVNKYGAAQVECIGSGIIVNNK